MSAFRAGLLIGAVLMGLGLYLTRQPLQPLQPAAAPIVPCSTDADCHRLNPGLCPDDQPYCFAPVSNR